MAQPEPPADDSRSRPGLHFPPLDDERRIDSDRPPLVFAGCVMAWVGDVLGFIVGIFLLFISADSAALDTVKASDRDSAASALHVVGGVLIVWCPLVIIVATFAYYGKKWAAMTLAGMATAYVLASIAGLVGGSTTQGGLSLIWSLVSAALVYVVPSSRAWFTANAPQRLGT
jgi:hypothetical protein